MPIINTTFYICDPTSSLEILKVVIFTFVVSSLVHDVIFTIKTSDEWFAATGATVYLEMMGEGTDTSGEFKAGTGFDGDR